MAVLEASLNLNKSAAEIFAYITDLNNQRKMSQYITEIRVDGPLKVGSRYTVVSNAAGRNLESVNEVIGYEQDRLFSVKTFAPPPASDMVNTTILESEGSGTKVTMKMEVNLVPPGMPSMPGMEDMMKGQMMGLLNDSLALLKKNIEG
ncbi:MAG: SRPBCC family protein [Anaerolineales bacterium]|uniref:SRPBCC family protein n=1 Tax=Candidatus Villigracilis vicinus TaxID=3140679 RepID=UPI003136CA8E|nr:SRPBCC family protein [Anaerolineales bacterium]MBK9781742.1 SRPBCC family protein [Anaerolineales bacterium]